MLAPLDNGTVFKAAFTDLIVFKQFVRDIIGIDIDVDRIETEKKFKPKAGQIDITLDIFAQSTDHRVIIEIQRIDYDYNFDRFLNYFLTAIIELQKSAKGYKIDQTVYTVVVLTAPYRYDEKNQRAIQDEVLITSVDPRNLQDQIIPIYGHKMIFLNHHYRNDNTPANYRDWLDLFYQSIYNPDNYKLNLANRGIRRAVHLIDYDHLTPRQMHQLKVDTQRKVMLDIHRSEGRREGRIKGLKEGRKEGLKEGRTEGRKEGLKEGLKEGRTEGLKEGLKEGRTEGRKEGLKEGRTEGKIEIARAMKEEGEPLDKISRYSGLSMEEIEKL